MPETTTTLSTHNDDPIPDWCCGCGEYGHSDDDEHGERTEPMTDTYDTAAHRLGKLPSVEFLDTDPITLIHRLEGSAKRGTPGPMLARVLIGGIQRLREAMRAGWIESCDYDHTYHIVRDALLDAGVDLDEHISDPV